MNIALCAAFLEEDVWENRLANAALPSRPELTECNSARTLLPLLELKPFSLLVVALNGKAGVKAVRQLRKRAPDIPLLWISNEDYSLFGYQYHVTRFLRKPLSDIALQDALAGCLKQAKEREKEGKGQKP